MVRGDETGRYHNFCAEYCGRTIRKSVRWSPWSHGLDHDQRTRPASPAVRSQFRDARLCFVPRSCRRRRRGRAEGIGSRSFNNGQSSMRQATLVSLWTSRQTVNGCPICDISRPVSEEHCCRFWHHHAQQVKFASGGAGQPGCRASPATCCGSSRRQQI